MGRTILITGASRGIGRAAAILAGRQGWSVGVNFLGNREAAEATVAAVRQAGGQAVALQGDMSVEADVQRVFGEAEAKLGRLQGVVVNAGIVAPPARVTEMDAARLRMMFEVNVLGAFLCAREAARRMARGGGGQGGSLVLISSVAARTASPGEYVDYAASKAAVDVLGQGLAREMGGEGVRVNVIRPGVIDTDIHASGGQPDKATRVGKLVPMGRAGQAAEIGEAIIWLLGDAASYTSGAVLDVSGGR